VQAAQDIQFDFEGSLVLARQLRAMAEDAHSMMSNRGRLAQDALNTWLGPHGVDFAERVTAEGRQIDGFSADLRRAADGWAICWKEAMDEQRRIDHARECERIRSSRSLLDSVVGGIFGHDDLPPPPRPVGIPEGPAYLPTASRWSC
jgi:hypothetical protein